MQTNPPPLSAAPAAILFDLDGTLIDSIELIVQSFEHCTTVHLGAPQPREKIYPIIGLSLVAELERVAPGRGDALLQTYRAFFLLHHDALIAEYAGVTALLEGLAERQIPLAIVTAKAMVSARPSFARFGLPERMATIVTFEDTTRHKPDPAPLLLAAERLRIAPRDCWYVGDSTHDMEAARAAGMRAIGAAWGPYGRAQLAPLADIVIDAPADLLTLVTSPPGPLS